MKLSDLCGEHYLSGVEFGSVENTDEYAWEKKCSCFKFRLDGVTYCAVEDPDDGYRSICRNLRVDDVPPKTQFPDAKVMGHMKEDSEPYYKNDILVLVDAETEKVVLEVGTAAYNDYYPYYVAEWHPENLIWNANYI